MNSENELRSPEDNAFQCSLCGQPLGTVARLEGEEHCRSCKREHGPTEVYGQ
jgi:ribosomal protein S14